MPGLDLASPKSASVRPAAQQRNICCMYSHYTRQQQNICCSILTTRDNSRTSAAAYPKHATTTEHLLQHSHHTRQQQNSCCIHTHYKRQQRNICCSIPTTSDNNGTSAACIPTTCDNNGTSAACIPTTCDNKYSSGYSSNRDEAIFGVRKASQSMFWEHLPSSTNLVSDWLRAESSPVDEEEIKIKMDDGVARYLTRLEGNLFIQIQIQILYSPSFITRKVSRKR